MQCHCYQIWPLDETYLQIAVAVVAAVDVAEAGTQLPVVDER